MMEELGLIDKRPRIVCAQAARANPLYQSYLAGFNEFEPVHAENTVASAIQIGNPVSYKRAVRVLREFDGIVEQATEDEIANASARGDLTGLYNCPHTGVALAALFKMVERGEVRASDRVIIISTANGLKFTDFKVDYHGNRLDDVNVQHGHSPLELPARYDDVIRAIDRTLA